LVERGHGARHHDHQRVANRHVNQSIDDLHEKAREHSRKPEAFYGLIESLCPGSKLELFARSKRAGWTVYGNETELFASEQSPSSKLGGNQAVSAQGH
jgi:N6-adenosine-specific RNA methylase IME4